MKSLRMRTTLNLTNYHQWVAAGIYLILALLFSISILRFGNDALVGSSDSTGLNFWATWWPFQAIARNFNIAETRNILFPISHNVFSLISLPTSLIYYLLRPLLGAVLAYNFILPIYSALNAFFFYLLSRRVISNQWVAAFSGAIIAFNPLTYAIAQNGGIYLLGFFVFPVWILLWENLITTPTKLNAIYVGIGLYLIVVMALQFWGLIFTTLIPYAIFRLLQQSDRNNYIDVLLWGTLLFLGLLLIYPLSIVIWSASTPLFTPITVWQGIVIINIFLLVFIGILFLASQQALRNSYLQRSELMLGKLLVGINTVCFLVPHLTPLNIIGVLEPNNKVPLSTFLLPILVVIVVLICKSTEKFITAHKPNRYVLFFCILAGLVISQWWTPFLAAQVSNATIYNEIRQEPESYVIANFPTSVDTLEHRYTGGLSHSDFTPLGPSYFAGQLLMAVPLHEKRVLGGLANRLTLSDEAIYVNNPLLQLLTTQPIEGNPKDLARTIRDSSKRWRIGYIIIHREQVSNEFLSTIRQWLLWSADYCYIASENNLDFWRARWHPAGCPPVTLELGDIDLNLVLGEGWSSAEQWGDQSVRWAAGQTTSKLSIWLTPGMQYRVKLRISSPQIENQFITVLTNGVTLGQAALQKEWGDYSFVIPREVVGINDGLVTIELQHRYLKTVEGRNLTAAYNSMSFEEDKS